MALPVVLKSGKNYMTVILDSEMFFPELLQHIVTKFYETEKFFGSEPFAIMVEGRTLSDTEKCQMLDAISEYTSINITVLIENDKVKEYAAEKAMYEKLHPEIDIDIDDEDVIETEVVDNCVFIDRDINDGEKISVAGSIYVKGNVSSGAMLKAGSSITVIGRLEGQAIAGNDPKAVDPFILASQFMPENFRIRLAIGDKPKKKKRGLKRRQKSTAKIARLKDGGIQIEDFIF